MEQAMAENYNYFIALPYGVIRKGRSLAKESFVFFASILPLPVGPLLFNPNSRLPRSNLHIVVL